MAFKNPALGWSQYRDANPVPTSPLADDLATTPSGPVACSVLPPIYIQSTMATVRFTQNVSCNIYTHPRYQQVANVVIIHQTIKATEYIGYMS